MVSSPRAQCLRQSAAGKVRLGRKVLHFQQSQSNNVPFESNAFRQAVERNYRRMPIGRFSRLRDKKMIDSKTHTIRTCYFLLVIILENLAVEILFLLVHLLNTTGQVKISFGYYIWQSIMTYFTKVNNEKNCGGLSMQTFQPSRFDVLPPALPIFIRFSRFNMKF